MTSGLPVLAEAITQAGYRATGVAGAESSAGIGLTMLSLSGASVTADAFRNRLGDAGLEGGVDGID